MIPKKKAEELNAMMEEALREKTPLNYFGEGSIIKAILSVVNETIEGFYEQLDFNTAMGFVSQAQGPFLDLIGELLDCSRELDESDDNYRYRITNQVYTVAGANATAIRLKCLSVDNVKDVRLVPYIKGAGSFVVYVNVEDRTLLNETLDAVQRAIDEVKGYGIKGEVVFPDYVPVDIRARLILKNMPATQKAGIIASCKQAVSDYIDNLDIEETLVMAHVIHRIMNASNEIVNVEIYSMEINDKPVMIADRHAKWNEQFIPRYIDIA